MSFYKFNHKGRGVSQHPWERIIKDHYRNKIKHIHNSVHNSKYPKTEKKTPLIDRVKFTIIGDMVTKEFNYCINIAKGLFKYRPAVFEPPVIRGVTTVEWPHVLSDIKRQYGTMAYCLDNSVAIILNDKFLGGEKEFREIINAKYYYHIILDYYKEGVDQFVKYIRASGRPCAYMHISIDSEHSGTMIFMLYADVVPNTCVNFLRLCQTKRGGYAGTPVHRIVKDGWIQCGGFGLKSTDLECENFIIPHDRRGVLCMANDGRHVDCSTQFFVLLQPAAWMASKYVAFGQLIEGESVLQKLETIPTWYESPMSEILIHKAGILNMECEHIPINKGTNEYIQGHIEDLIALGDTLIEEVLAKTFLEIQFREVAGVAVEGEGEEAVGEEKRNIRATERFIRKKEEIDKQLKSQSLVDPRRPSAAESETIDENNEFDVELYEYESEESSYKHISLVGTVSLVVKPEKPFYIPLTDVLDPEEIESTYDLKKFLKGDYCLESDLEDKLPKKIIAQELSFISDIFKFGEDSEESSVESLESEDEREIRRYLKFNVDRVSFAGDVIKGIARGVGKCNLFEGTRKSELITDEELRRFRKVRIAASAVAAQTGSRPMRRPTGFVRPSPLKMSDSDIEVRRQSVLTRLYENVTLDDDDDGPTLKEYRPAGGSQHKNVMLTYSSPNSRIKSDENAREKYLRHSLTAEKESFEEILNLQHGKKFVARKISSDYVKTIDQVEQNTVETSIRSVEFSKSRPSMSVSQYQAKNQEYKKKIKSVSQLKEKLCSKESGMRSSGLRLPGDTPLYSETTVA
ncbi:peptidyl-prolyl cis-trans isomerase G-like isoform X2 [Pieris napi]|uniref:peptidyl-prolyl cis-trans isomerase G-like isoform X2 n=1 Tax=Pieris napi TaxID=78633 RepID=UPI001FB90D8A|nr:peptidyl-prolyl cis-trans isomerase G-like isoform X2 [Pieris napi]